MPSKRASLVIEINRAPVLTLWAAVVAERLGFGREEALTLGKAVAGLNAQSKGRRLGIYEAKEAEPVRKSRRGEGEQDQVELLGRTIPIERGKGGVRAVVKGQSVTPASVERYLEGRFGEHLEAAREAMAALARKFGPEELARSAFGLYEQFRPAIPAGVKGWGAAGKLDLRQIAAMG